MHPHDSCHEALRSAQRTGRARRALRRARGRGRHRRQPQGQARRSCSSRCPAPRPTGCASSPQALAAGAAAVVAERAPPALPDGRRVRAGRQCAARARARGGAILSAPAETIAAVTGTSGKTSVAAFTRQIWAALGYEAASIGTIGVVTPKREVYGSLTTPDPVDAASHARSSSPTRASRIWRWRRPRTGSTSTASTACASRPAASPISARDHLDYHPTRRGLSRGQAAAVRSAGGRRRRRGDRRRSRAQRGGDRGGDERAACELLTVGRKGDGIRLRRHARSTASRRR